MQETKKYILFINQSADLYGSDKTLLFLVESIKDVAKPIVVVPEEGPLTEEFKRLHIEYIIAPVIKVSRRLFKSLDFLRLPFTISRQVKSLKKKLGDREIAAVHSNTLAVLLGAFYSKKYKIKHVWHVHEIIKHPKIVAKVYPHLVHRYSDRVVFNSKASATHLYKNHPKLEKKSSVIYNGLDRDVPISSHEEKEQLRKSIFPFMKDSDILLGLFGRINRHKGHQILLNAFEQIRKEGFENVYLLFIGSTIPAQQFLLEDLKTMIAKKELNDVVKIIDFQKEIWKFYDALDILLVPTTDPEPFGLVAVEGMLSKKPVIASNHGGLKEIVVHNETGLLFEPNNQEELKRSIVQLIQNQSIIFDFGGNGAQRAKTEFSLNQYISNFKDFYLDLMA